jgi:hypothetical protein
MVRDLGPAARAYRCPGCDQVISPGQQNLVVWRADSWRGEDAAIQDRRHWHKSCWRSRP